MGLFFKKKETDTCCAASGTPQPETRPADGADTGVKVLGSGCAKCRALEQSAREALAELNLEPAVDHVTDFARIAAYGVMSTPALVVDGRVVSCGKVLSKDEAKKLIQNTRGKA